MYTYTNVGIGEEEKTGRKGQEEEAGIDVQDSQ
jgi:hypothetical protein